MASPISPFIDSSARSALDPSEKRPSRKKKLIFGGNPKDNSFPTPLENRTPLKDRNIQPATTPIKDRNIQPATTPTKPEHIKADHVYKAYVSPGGTTRLPYPPTESGYSVYAMFNKQTGATYIGSTTQAPQDRFKDHAFHISHPEDERSSAPVYQQLSKDPENVRIAVLEHHKTAPKEDLANLERHHVALIPSHLRLNANKGGGGGLSFRAAQAAAVRKYGPPSTPPSPETTPNKSYGFREKNNRIVCDLTPSAKKRKGIIYSIEGPEGSYTGFTTRTATERVQEHARKASQATTKKPLYKALGKDPKAYKLQLHASGVKYPSHLVKLEAKIIEHKKAKHPVFNQNEGGGGCFRRG